MGQISDYHHAILLNAYQWNYDIIMPKNVS